MGIKLYFGINKNISKELLVIIIIKTKRGCQEAILNEGKQGEKATQ